MTRVLVVVEDEPPFVRALTITLRSRAVRGGRCPDGTTALRLAAERKPDGVVLDVGLPDMGGIDVIKALRGWTRVPFVVLSARRTTHEKGEAFEAGADGHLTKPFDMAELLARLRAAVRRNTGDGASGVLPADEPRLRTVRAEDFTVDLAANKLEKDPSHPRHLITEPGTGYRFEG